MRKKPIQLKPQDILVLLKLLIEKGRAIKSKEIAENLEISQAEIINCLNRLLVAQLLSSDQKTPLRENALEFLVHGLKYAFPPQFGQVSRGVPAAHSSALFADKIMSSDLDRFVWPDEEGNSRGQSILPIYSTVPKVAVKDKEMGEYLNLIEAIRVGRTRERVWAQKELERRIIGQSEPHA